MEVMSDKQTLEEPKALLDDEKEDQEAIIEETKEYTELVKFPCPPLTISYDVLDLLEESYENIEENNYWEFLGPLVYDSSRPCSAIMDPSSDIGVGKEVFPIIN